MKMSCVGEWFFMRSSENEFFRSLGPLGGGWGRGKERAGREGVWLEGRVLQ